MHKAVFEPEPLSAGAGSRSRSRSAEPRLGACPISAGPFIHAAPALAPGEGPACSMSAPAPAARRACSRSLWAARGWRSATNRPPRLNLRRNLAAPNLQAVTCLARRSLPLPGASWDAVLDPPCLMGTIGQDPQAAWISGS